MHNDTFERLRAHEIPSLRLTVEEYRHRRTGALHYHLAAPDRNNAFLVAFLTMPQDSTGVAHILEHTSLCGSRRFPVRDPFFMMLRRSLATFMNAFTSSDWTAYPFASQTRKDFDNLLQVYLDAAFFPRLDPLDFAQEGHRLEPAEPGDPDAPLVYKGVVYNEMKGAMSAPTTRLWHLLQEHLFPTVTYHYNSGGSPEEIPKLTHEDLVAFHARHYHPSNAVLMTYGDIPAAEHHARFEEHALRHFDRLDMNLRVPDERRYDAPVTAEGSYPVAPEEGTRDRTHVVLGWLLGRTTDLRAMLRAQLLSGVLLDNSASPLRRALETTGLGSAPSELCGLDDSTREATFMAGLEGTNLEQAAEVESLVLGVLRQVAESGVPRETVEAVLHQLELSQREVSGGYFPYGLRLMVTALPAALHGGDPVASLDLDPALRELREEVRDPRLIPRLVQELLLDNPHRVRVTMAPDPELSARAAREEQARLAAAGEALDRAARERLAEQARALELRQAEEDDPSLLPKVGLEDVPTDLPIAEGESTRVDGMSATTYLQGTNGLVYAQLVVDLPDMDRETADLLPWYCDVVSEVGAAGRDYLQLQAEQAAVTGGIGASFSLRGDVASVDRARGYFVLSAKALVANAGAMARLLRDHFVAPRFDELGRLRELVAQLRAQRDLAVTDHGHVLAMTAATAGMGPSPAAGHRWNGMLGLRRLRELDASLRDEAALEAFAAGLERLHRQLLAARRQLLVVCEPEAREAVLAALEEAWQGVAPVAEVGPYVADGEPRRVAEGWSINAQVSFCARAYPTVPIEHPDAAPLMVLGSFLTNGYLHRAIREQGGAYGAGAGYDSDAGAFRFFSYRDPRLEGTLEDFDRALAWLQETRHESRTVEEAVLGVVSSIDRPDSPAGEATKAFFGSLHGRTPAQRRRFRQRVLEVGLEDLRGVAERWLRPEQASTAVLADAGSLQREGLGQGLEIQTLS
jgi:hypothetical protein